MKVEIKKEVSVDLIVKYWIYVGGYIHSSYATLEDAEENFNRIIDNIKTNEVGDKVIKSVEI